MRSYFLPFSPPSIGNKEIDEVIDMLWSDWITTGPKSLFSKSALIGFDSDCERHCT